MEVAPFFVGFHNLRSFVAIYIMSRFTHFFRNFFLAKIAFSATSHIFCMYDYDAEDHLGRFAACHEWYTIHNLCWTRACHDHQPRRWSGMVWEYFFTHWLQGFAIFSLALLFIIGPLSQNWKVWQPLCCWLEKTLCMFDYQDKKFCESTIYFFIAKTWENFLPSGILHLEYLLLLHVSSTSPWALTNLRSWPSLLASVRDQPP